jgi:hypothetical protein
MPEQGELALVVGPTLAVAPTQAAQLGNAQAAGVQQREDEAVGLKRALVVPLADPPSIAFSVTMRSASVFLSFGCLHCRAAREDAREPRARPVAEGADPQRHDQQASIKGSRQSRRNIYIR